MKDLEIDEEQIALMGKALEEIINSINGSRKVLIDTNEDLFKRYMAFMHMYAFINIFDSIDVSNRIMFKGGYDLNNKIFHTKKFKEFGWDKGKDDITNNPFFIDAEDFTNEFH